MKVYVHMWFFSFGYFIFVHEIRSNKINMNQFIIYCENLSHFSTNYYRILAKASFSPRPTNVLINFHQQFVYFGHQGEKKRAREEPDA